MGVEQDIGALRIVCAELEALTDQRKRLKARLPEGIADRLRTLPIPQGKAWLQELYWMTPDVAVAIRKAHKTVYGKGDFLPRIREFAGTCADCGRPILWPCRSWSKYREMSRDVRRQYVCPDCGVQREQQQLAEHREWEAQRGRRERAEKAHMERLQGLPYAEYLLTHHWRQVRASALWRAKSRCQLCNGVHELNVHHRTYERRGCELPADVIVLCENCHLKHHHILADTEENEPDRETRGSN